MFKNIIRPLRAFIGIEPCSIEGQTVRLAVEMRRVLLALAQPALKNTLPQLDPTV
jgi:hypothetical protein